jgi:transaldolase
MSQPDTKKPKMTSLEQLKASGTLVVADTGDFEAIAKFKPRFGLDLFRF